MPESFKDEREFDGDSPPGSASAWLHDARNSVNTLGVTVALGRRMLERGDRDAAVDMLARSEHAWRECRDLLGNAPLELGAAPLPFTAAAATGRPPPPVHR
ncbi:hypothetical protein [Lysobacter xanthus]